MKSVLYDLPDFVFRHFRLDRERRRIGLRTGFLQDLARDAARLADGLAHVHRGMRIVRKQ
jgi:hypothetical protein